MYEFYSTYIYRICIIYGCICSVYYKRYDNLKKSTALKMALAFGVFQGGMPLLGWALGISFESYIKSIDHWIAFILLGFIGFNMIKGFFDDRKEGKESELEFSATADEHDLSNKEIIMLAEATSIDALAVGISFAFLNVSIIPAASIICIITFLVCVVGVFVGNKVGDIFNGYAELVGGVILILIGFNIFNEHTQILNNIFNSLF